MNESTKQRHHVVIIGSGFGGLFATTALKDASVDVTVIAKTNHHLFQPLLYQVATGILSEGAIAPPTREILRGQCNAQVRLGEVIDIDIESRTVTSWTPSGTLETSYDSLIVAAGSSVSYFGHKYFAEHAPGMKSLDDALELRGRILSAFEFAEIETEPDATAPWLTFVVVGAGPTGVEMAGQIAELAHRTLRKDYRRIDPLQARVVLLEGASMVLGTFGEHLAAKATKKLEQLVVEVQLGAVVVDVDEYGIDIKGRRRQHPPHREPHQGVGSRRRCLSVGHTPRQAGGSAGRSSGSRPRAGRLLTVRVSRGLRHRRHDGCGRAGCGAGGYAVGQTCRQGDRCPGCRSGPARTVQVCRQGEYGDDFAVCRGGQRR